MANDLTSLMPKDSGGEQFLAMVDPTTESPVALKAGTITRTAITGSPTGLNASALPIESADGSQATVGTTTDTAYAGSGGGSLVAILKGLYAKLAGNLTSKIVDSAGTNQLAVDSSGHIGVNNFPATQPVSGTVSVNALPAGGNLIGQVEVSDGTNVLGTAAHPVKTDPTGTTTQPVSGTVTAATNADTTIGGTAAPAKELLIGGKTSDVTPQYQPLPLTNGGAAVKTDGSATTQPVSGTVSVNALPAGTNLIGQVEVSDGTNVLGTSTHPVRTDPTGTTPQPVSGSVTANIGTTNGVALDTSVNGLLIAQGSATSGEKGPLAQGAVTTAAPAYTTGQTSPLSLTPTGALRTDSSATTQPVSASSLPLPTGAAQEAGNLATAATNTGTTATNTGAISTATGATADAAVTGDTAGSLSAKLRGLSKIWADVWDSVNHRLHVNVDAGTVTANAGTNLNTSLLALESGGNLAAAKTDLDSIKTSVSAFNDVTSSGAISADQGAVIVVLTGGQATALVTLTGTFTATLNFEGYNDAAQTWEALYAVNASTNAIGTTTSATGAYRVAIGGLTNFRVRAHPYTSGTVTVTITLTQTAQNVTVMNATPLGQAASASSAPVVIASDQIVPTQGNKTVIAGQGTGVVNGINTFLIPATDVSTYRWLSLQIAGTFTLSLIFEASNDNTNWFNVPLTSVSNAPVTNYFTSSTGFIYDGPVLFNYFRVRVSSYTSNSSLAGTLLLLTTPPVNQPYAPVTSYLGTRNWGGTLNTHLVTAATTNALNIRASATQLFRAEVGNNSATDCWLHFFNKATTPTPGTDSAIKSIYVPKGTRQFYENNIGLYAFTSGMGITVTGGSGVTDNTATTAGITVDVEYI